MTVDAVVSLFIEGLAVLPVCLPFIIYSEITGAGALSILANESLWLLPIIGIVTGLPLILYSKSLKKLPMALLGFLQYINSFISFIISVAVFNESFAGANLIGYIFIWLSLILFSVGSFKGYKSSNETPNKN